jgi:hypothetical protein
MAYREPARLVSRTKRFFEPPAPLPESEQQRPTQPDWMGRPMPNSGCPRWLIPSCSVAQTQSLSPSATCSHTHTALSSYCRCGGDRERRIYWEAHEFMIRRHRRRTESGEFDPHVLRFGVQFSDGRKATNLGSPFGGFAPRGRQTVRRLAASWPDGENKPTGLRLIEWGRSGSAGRYDQRYWLWPHPPTGALAFVCEWPSEQIEETRVEIDSAPILEAATRSVVLWAEEPNAHTVVRCACLRVGDANPFEFLGRPGLGLHADTCGVHAAAAKKMEAIRRSRWSKGCAS